MKDTHYMKYICHHYHNMKKIMAIANVIHFVISLDHFLFLESFFSVIAAFGTVTLGDLLLLRVMLLLLVWLLLPLLERRILYNPYCVLGLPVLVLSYLNPQRSYAPRASGTEDNVMGKRSPRAMRLSSSFIAVPALALEQIRSIYKLSGRRMTFVAPRTTGFPARV